MQVKWKEVLKLAFWTNRFISKTMRCQVTLAAFLQSFCQYLWFVFTFPDLLFLFFYVNYNKCIGDDTKAAARQSLNCIKNKKKLNMAKNDFQYGGWNFYTLQCGTIITFFAR